MEAEPGRWLCESLQVHEVETPGRSLLTFVSDPSLPPGRMRIKHIGPLRYQVSVRPDVLAQLSERRRDLRMAALVGAVSMLREDAERSLELADGGSDDDGAEPGEELAYLRRHGIEIGGDGFDALEAATRIESVLAWPTLGSDDE